MRKFEQDQALCKRLDLAFAVIDIDGSGTVELGEIVKTYETSPEVVGLFKDLGVSLDDIRELFRLD